MGLVWSSDSFGGWLIRERLRVINHPPRLLLGQKLTNIVLGYCWLSIARERRHV